MLAWRISRAARAHDLSGQGAAIDGGRWNDVDIPALYMGLTPAICCLETFVHLSGTPLPPQVITRFILPDDDTLYARPDPADLPEGWDAIPADRTSMLYGSAWLKSARHLGLIVPSAILTLESILVINPAHPAKQHIRVDAQFDFRYDRRMFSLTR